MWRELEPRATRLWVRFAPRRWPAAATGVPAPAGLDLADRRISWSAAPRASAGDLPSSPPSGDVVLLPPLEKDRTREKQNLASAILASGGVVLDQRWLSQPSEPAAEATGATVVSDLLFPLLEGNLAVLENLAPDSIALVPLIPGLSSDEASWQPLVTALVSRSPVAVVGVAPELSPVDRRRLVEWLGEESFERVHHSGASAPDLERRFARAVAAAGLNPFFERPAAKLSPRAARNRRIATVLFESGERWLALGRREPDGASLLAAARHVEAATQEIAALARERQLALLPYLSPLARETVAAFVESGRSSLLAELRAEWVGAEVHA
jgi:hypothetical protein